MTPKGGPLSIVDYRSYRIKRVTRSTLGAEASACDYAVDHGKYVQAGLLEILVYDFRATEKKAPPAGLMEAFAFTDCRSVYDCLIKITPPS